MSNHDVPLVRFKGRLFMLLGNLETGGPIATIRQHRTGRCSFAHLYSNGCVKRFGAGIGSRDDIHVVGRISHRRLSQRIDLPEAFEAMLTDDSWLGPIQTQ